MHKQPENKQILAELGEFAEIFPVPFYWVDLNQKILGVNSLVVQGIGFKSKEDLIGKTAYDMYSQKMAEEIIGHHKQVLKKGKREYFEEIIQNVQTNEIKIFDAIIAPLYDENGIIGTCGISIDVTAKKKLEQELIGKDQLKKEFIKNFSHDVRLPMNGIIGNTQLLQILAKDNPKLKQSAMKVDDGVMSLSKMFDALYSAIANDELSNQIYDKDFSFQEMIDLEIALAKSSIPPNLDITVNVELDDKIPKKLHGDVFKTSQILRNILSNSVRYTKAGEIKLTADVLEDVPDTIKIKFTIADTGTGITTTEKDKIYEYGRRFITSYETNVPGTGIGMYIVKQHVDALGGTIDYDSTVGEGTQWACCINPKTKTTSGLTPEFTTLSCKSCSI